MLPSRIYLWQSAPALRMLLPFIGGILLQWYAQPTIALTIIALAAFLLLLPLFAWLPLRLRFKAAPLQGLAATGLVMTAAMVLTHLADVRNKDNWFGRSYDDRTALLVTLQEPLVEKPASFKAVARVEKRVQNDSVRPASGSVILYFKKDAAAGLHYGSQLWVAKKVEKVKNSGNPAAFDYERYSLFHRITHQAFLKAEDFVVLPVKKEAWLYKKIFGLQARILAILKTYIQGERESGLAEALLIGYKDDLDKPLVQAYSNTGVVHIIAISGLHVGLIYGLLLFLTKPLRGKGLRGLRCIVILAALWGFGLLAGAQPSVMRSVVMFSVMALGTVLSRKAPVYNSLALSALLLLAYNPFWLWDAGFQLSYSAVLSIVVFFKPVYNWLYVQNKALDAIWKLMAVTLAAQILTTPISLYYFHQFPVLFLFTNIIAVPLSSAVLFGEILLCALAALPPVASAVGWLTTKGISLMNAFIERMDAVPFAVWEGVSISAVQAALLLVFIAGVAYWLLEKKKPGLWLALVSLLAFTALRTFSFLHAARQQELIVYNISKHQAIEVVSGRTSLFLSETALHQDRSAMRFHIRPSRIAHRIRSTDPLQAKAFRFCGKRVLILDTTAALQTFSATHVDVLILSKNPKLFINDLAAHVAVSQIVVDASVPLWKAARWQRDCEALGIPCHSVAQKGAFVMTAPSPTFAAPRLLP